MAMASSNDTPSLALGGDKGSQRYWKIDENDYPFGLPSFSPSITNVRWTQSVHDRAHFGKTRCDIFEASALDHRWRRDVDDEGLNIYLNENGDTGFSFRAL